MEGSGPASDSHDLASFGYRQELHRTLGSFSSFAAAFSYISILTGMFQLFYLGFGLAGPAFWWSWIIVFAGQFAVALCFAEMAARYPIAGSVYQWSKQVAGKTIAWMAGWIMMLASIVTVAAVALAWQIILPQISTHFQFVGDGTGSHDFAENAVILGLILIAFTTTVNILGVRLMSRINNFGVAAELIGASVLVVLLAIHTTRGPQIVTHTFGTGPGLPGHSTLGYGAAFLIGAIMPAYVMYGFDTAGSLAEETSDPRRRAPRAILMALGAAGVVGMLLLLVALMSGEGSGIRTRHSTSNGLPVPREERARQHPRRHPAVGRRAGDLGVLPRDPHGSDPHDVLDGARRRPAGKQPTREGVPREVRAHRSCRL